MTPTEPPWPGPRSGAPLPSDLPPVPVDDLPADGARLREGGLLGAGGMGEVRASFDPGLVRDVAVKVPRGHSDAEDARLVAEARLTARLEHPGIVPVYHAGRMPDGRPYYAMRLLRGRSLADTVAATPSADRLSLVPRVLAVANALAYAHEAGVIHRDVKPSNVLVGPFGETLLTDWGIAAAPSTGAGTPRYMSPEQAAGAPLDGRADVYALGVLLGDLLDATAPPELAAIAARAQAPRPDDRYPTMKAFVADLEAWFEGRRVAAYRYGPRELLVRFVRAWRAPLAVAAVATLVVAAAVATAWWRTTEERNRAVAAEAASVEAAALAEASLATALVAQSLTAAADELRPEAELLAAHALVLAPSPEARGVLARFGQRARPTQLAAYAGPSCESSAFNADGSRLVCARAHDVLLLDPARPDEVIASWPHRTSYAEPDSSGAHVVLLDEQLRPWLWTPPADPVLVAPFTAPFPRVAGGAVVGRVAARSGGQIGELDVVTGARWMVVACGAASLTAYAAHAEGAVGACADGDVVRASAGQIVERRHVDLPSPATALAWRDGNLALGTSRGALVIVGEDGQARTLEQAGASHRALRFAGPWLAALTDQGDVSVYDLRSGRRVTRMRLGAQSIALRPDGVLRALNERVEDLAVGEAPWPGSFATTEGVATVQVGPDWLAMGLGDGVVDVQRLTDGAPITRLSVGTGVVKALAPWKGGIAAGNSNGPDMVALGPPDWTVTERFPLGALRRADRVAGGLIALPYGPGLRLWGVDPVLDLPADRYFWDLLATPAGDAALLVNRESEVWRLQGSPLRARLVSQGYNATAVAALGDDTLIAAQGGVVRIDPSGAATQHWPLSEVVVDMEVSHDGRLVAAGMMTGSTTVLRAADGAVLARLIGHTARVAAVTFSDDDRWLVTGSWDASARLWSMAELDADPATLEARLVAAWGRGWQEVLRQ